MLQSREHLSCQEGTREIVRARKTSTSELVQLIYVSKAAYDLGPQEAEAIAAVSEANNKADGLTGLLLHRGNRFYGVLEGTQRRVFARMERIIVDGRHRNLRILRERSIPARRFENWSFASLPEAATDRIADVSPEEFILNLTQRLK